MMTKGNGKLLLYVRTEQPWAVLVGTTVMVTRRGISGTAAGQYRQAEVSIRPTHPGHSNVQYNPSHKIIPRIYVQLNSSLAMANKNDPNSF